jgi:DNA-binding LacI/PurR family transcriptional regulator
MPDLISDKVEKFILGLIQKGKVKQGDCLPSERSIGKMFNASQVPVRQATERLADKGILEKIRGKGTFVKRGQVQPVRTNTIGVLYWPTDYYFVSSSYYSAILGGIQVEAERQEKQLLYRSYMDNGAREVTWNPGDYAEKVDGIIVAAMLPQDREKMENLVRASGKPAVILNNEAVSADIDSVVFEYHRVAREMTQYLQQQGHQRTGCFYHIGKFAAGIVSPSTTAMLEGYRSARRETGQDGDELVVCLRYSPDESYTKIQRNTFSSPAQLNEDDIAQLKKLLDSGNAPTAFFCVGDEVALNVYLMAEQMGLKIPDDISVVGVGNIRECETVRPKLTTMHTPLIGMGSAGLARVLQRQEELEGGGGVPQRIVLPGKIMERGSHRSLV